jgi:hypothetical protein
MRIKMEPKYVLTYDNRHPGAPYTIRERAMVGGVVSERPDASFSTFEEAITHLRNVSKEQVILAIAGTIDNTFELR